MKLIPTFERYVYNTKIETMNESVYGNKAIVYHRTKLPFDKIDKIIKNKEWDFGSNEGSAYGNGLYTTYSLESQMSF